MHVLRNALAAAALLAYGPALGQTSAPIGGNVTIPTTAGTLIPVQAGATTIRYQVQGTGYACVSWVTAAVTIDTNTPPTCGGPGAFRVADGSVDARLQNPIPNLVLTGVAASGAAMKLVYEVR